MRTQRLARVAFGCVILLLLQPSGAALAQEPASYSVDVYFGPTAPECEALAAALKEAVKQWSTGGKRAVYDPSAMWNLLPTAGWTPYGRTYALAEYVRQEDGLITPIRTGKEVPLYNLIKTFARDQPTQSLDYQRILQLALDASKDGSGRANISIAMLTAHNVMRVLARPKQWWHTYKATDPMKDVFLDLRSGAAGSLAQILKDVRSMPVAMPGGQPVMGWTDLLFERNGGVFATVTGAKDAVWNGGSHYYFWLGAVADMHLGYTALTGGALWEFLLKAYESAAMQGMVQLQHYGCGAAMADRLWWDSNDFRPGAPLAITGTTAPAASINNAPAKDYSVFWEGDAVAPLTVTASPLSCPAGGCQVVTRTFTEKVNPLVMKAASWCYGYSQSFSVKYQVVLTDSASHASPAFPVDGACLVPTAPK